MSDSVQPCRRQPTRLPRPWDSPGKNIGVGFHFLLQYMKEKSESEVAQSCLTLSDPMDCSLPGFSVHGIFPGKSTGVGCHCLLRQEAERVPFRISPRRNTPRHILIKLTKIKHKERILKAAREKQQVIYKGNPIHLTADFSAEILQARREWQDIYIVMKVKSENEVAQSCLTLSDPMDCSLPGSSIHGIFPGKSTGVGCHCRLHYLHSTL